MNKTLGRGINALLDSSTEATDRTTGITTVEINSITPNRYQPRKEFNQEKLLELAESIKQNGVIQPIIVTKKDKTQYELIAGERRLQASKIAGFDRIPVIIRSVSKKEQLQFAIIENIQRENLNAIEEALAYQQLHTEFSLKHVEISEIVGKDRATVTNTLRLLKLPESVQNMIASGKLSSGHARAILQVDEKDRKDFAQFIVSNGLSVRKTEIEAKKFQKNEKKEKREFTNKQEEKIIEEKLIMKFKTKIKVQKNKNKGKIIFYYKSKEELENLLESFE